MGRRLGKWSSKTAPFVIPAKAGTQGRGRLEFANSIFSLHRRSAVSARTPSNQERMATERQAYSLAERLQVLTTPRVRQVTGVIAFAVLTAISAKIALPVAGTQVPFTFQPLAVLLTGALLGARLGGASQVLYLAAG